MDTFTENVDKFARGATEVENIATNTACRDACLALPITECAAYEWDTRSDGSCWIHATAPSSLGTLSGVNHYVRVEATNCVTPCKYRKCSSFIIATWATFKTFGSFSFGGTHLFF